MNISALSIRGLRKRYGRRVALDGLDIEVPRGSLFGLVGSNGAGKTTMMTCCAGLLRIDGGEIDLLSRGAPDPVRHRGLFAILPQDARLPLHARVGELMTFYGQLLGIRRTELEKQVSDLLEWVNLTDRRNAPVRSLSHGMMRRLTVAQAFIGQPQLVFLDEPMSGLDPREVNRMRRLFTDRPPGQTIVISSHILGELEAVCDHVAFVEKGRLVKQGPLSAMMRHHHRIVYHVRGTPWPMEKLKAAVPGGTWKEDADTSRIELSMDDASVDPVEINNIVLRILLDGGVGVVEVLRGSDLEREFLQATQNAS